MKQYIIEFYISNKYTTPVRKFTLTFRNLDTVILWADENKKDDEYYHIIG